MAPEGLSRIVNHEYRLTRTNEGLKIEVLDYHAGPLLLTPALLREFGASFRRAISPADGPSRPAREGRSERSSSV